MDNQVTGRSRWLKVERLFDEALARDPAERRAFLDESCGDDKALRREVESLLDHAGDAERFMNAPVADLVTTLVSDTMRPPSIGQRLGPYEIQSLLGAGGMGEVYRARDVKLGRDVAIKILPDAFTEDAERLSRFEREARLLAAVNHPHIGTIYGFEDRDGIHALVLELIEGETLADRLRGGPLPLRDTLVVARQIAEALEAAHDKGIVHRDLKPANVLLQGTRRSTSGRTDSSARSGDEMFVKVVDFGLATIGGAESNVDLSYLTTLNAGKTEQGVILGTATYMSPEQARGRAVDKRTDVWAFGCLLYEMLAGRTSFGGDTLSDTLVAILERQPDWSAVPDATPPAIRRLVRRCLEKDARRRLHDIADARIEIEETLDQPAAPSAEVRADGSPRRLLTPKTIGWAAAAAVAMIALAGVAALSWWPKQAPPLPAFLARLMITLPAAHVLEKGRFPSVALSPDGKLLVYAAAVSGGRTNLYLRPLDDVTARRVPETEGASSPFFSPDGRWLAFYANGQLKRVSVAGGVPLTICDAPPVWSASWGDHDAIVFATTLPSSGLWMVSANGGDPTQITTPKPDETQHAYPQLLPGGTQVLFSVRRENTWRLGQLDVKTRTWHLLGTGRVVGEGAQYVRTGHLVYAQAGGLVATAFEPSNGGLDQPPVPLLERIETSRFGGAYFAIASDAGTLVYVPATTTTADGTLLRVDRDGRVAALIEARGAYEHPMLSRDGRKVALTIRSEGGNDIWIVDLDRATRLRFTAGGTSAFPVWTANGSSIAFQSTAPGPWNLLSKPADGSAEAHPLLEASSSPGGSWPNTGANLLPGTLPTLSGAGPQFPMSWTPDGSTLAFHERKPSGERDIWIVAPGKDPVPFVLTPFDERLPRFSPDGKWLAYVSDESGRNDVYVQPFPGPGSKWLVSIDGGDAPVWSKDGRELFYRHNDQMMAATVSAKDEFAASRPQRLFELRFDAGDNGPNYDVAPDGKWFVMPRSDQGTTSGELHLVLNWFSEVTARARTTSARLRTMGSDELAARWKPGQ